METIWFCYQSWVRTLHCWCVQQTDLWGSWYQTLSWACKKSIDCWGEQMCSGGKEKSLLHLLFADILFRGSSCRDCKETDLGMYHRKSFLVKEKSWKLKKSYYRLGKNPVNWLYCAFKKENRVLRLLHDFKKEGQSEVIKVVSKSMKKLWLSIM